MEVGLALWMLANLYWTLLLLIVWVGVEPKKGSENE